MLYRARAVVLMGALALAGCGVDEAMPPGDVPTPALDLRDGRSGGSPRFFFQPPIAPTIPYQGTFDPGAHPIVMISQLSPPGPLMAQFTDTSAARVFLEPKAEQYVVPWRTSTCNIGPCRMEPGRTYRVFVLDPRTFAPYGWADVKLVRKAEQLPLVPPGVLGVVFGQVLPIRFRIERTSVAFAKVNPVQSVVDVGTTRLLTVTTTDSSGHVVPHGVVTWLSSNPAAVVVSSIGLVTGISPGSAMIQAIVDGVRGTALVTAEYAPALRVLPARAVIPVGQGVQLAAADVAGVPVPGVLWFAPDPGIAVVSSTGLVTGVAPGVARIRALTNSAMYEALVTVQGAPPQVNVMPPRDSLVIGQQRTLIATDINGAPIASAIQWSSSNSGVAWVMASLGVVTAAAPGTATIFATAGPATGQATVVVVAAPEVAPVALQPGDSVRVRQDDPTTTCSPGLPGGFGFAFPFSWIPGSGPKPRIGDHFVLKDSTGTSVIDTPTGQNPGLWWAACGVVVPDHLLDGWTWRVQTQYSDGTFGPWSLTRVFGFLPRDASPTFTTFPLDYGAGKTQVSIGGSVDAVTSSTVRLSVQLTTSVTAFLPAGAVEFHRHDGTFYRSIGRATGCVFFDNGTTRFFRCSLDWDPAPPVGPGTFAVVASVVAPNGARYVGSFLNVTVVP